MRNITILLVLISTLTFATCTSDTTTKTVYYDKTNLMWQDDVSTTNKTWQEAIEYCENLTLANYSDWRLPNINELLSIVDYVTSKTTSDIIATIKDGFVNTKIDKTYWTSTIYSGDKTKAWYVDFQDGKDYQQIKSTTNAYIRCVRTK